MTEHHTCDPADEAPEEEPLGPVSDLERYIYAAEWCRRWAVSAPQMVQMAPVTDEQDMPRYATWRDDFTARVAHGAAREALRAFRSTADFPVPAWVSELTARRGELDKEKSDGKTD